MDDTEITWDQLVHLCRRSIAIASTEYEAPALVAVNLAVSGQDNNTLTLETMESEEPYCFLFRRMNLRMPYAGASVWVNAHDGGHLQLTLYRSVHLEKELKGSSKPTTQPCSSQP